MTIHQLKTTRNWFQRVAAGEKTAEIRKHDRDYQAGDILELVETRADDGWATDDDGERVWQRAGDATGEVCEVVVTHVLPSAQFDGLSHGYCMLSIRPRTYLAHCAKCGRGMNPGDQMCCPSLTDSGQ